MGAGVATSPHCPEYDDLAWVQQGDRAQAVWVSRRGKPRRSPVRNALARRPWLAGKLPGSGGSTFALGVCFAALPFSYPARAFG